MDGLARARAGAGGGHCVSEAAVAADRLAALLAERTDANRQFFNAEAERLARVCHLMAERFARGGRLVAFGRSPAARSDTRHVAVEFVHPVIVGKRALPAIGLAGEGGDLERQVELIAAPDDVAMAFGADEDGGEATRALALARGRGCLTIAFCSCGAEWEFAPPSEDPSVRQELVETLYHVLWELVHVFFEHRGLLEGRNSRRVHDVGASSFLYPFLAEQETELEPVIDDVSRSARELRAALEAGGKLLALGNGGSATDAMDVVADFRSGGAGLRSWTAIDLTEDPSILTAIANDIGTEAIFSRQVIAYGLEGDALIALSTSGNSGNVIHALAEARRRGMLTIAMVGYDGGRIGSEGLADHVVITRSEHIPRIQEAQASAYHALRALVG
jgi:D-sedoheptulose 7-phosphate isomerase